MMLATLLALALTPGPSPVGFTVRVLHDPSRAVAGAPRVVQLALWYPARDEGTAPLRYADYVAVTATEATDAEPTPGMVASTVAAHRVFLRQVGMPGAGVERWLTWPMHARRETAPAPGRYPLVLLAQGTGGAAPDQAMLAEHLASHGFVVVTCPSPVRLGARLESDADVLPVAEEHARDLELALSALRDDPRVDATRVGVVGYSFGARSALLIAARQPAVRALVSLDGGIGTATAPGWLPAAALDRARFRVPLLHVYEDQEREMRPDFALLDSLRSSQLRLRVDGVGHHDFITAGFLRSVLPELGLDAAGRAALSARLAAVVGEAVAFLKATVVGDPAAQAWLKRPVGPGLRLTRVSPGP